MRDNHVARLVRVFELDVITLATNLRPTLLFQTFYYFGTCHDVYYTHQYKQQWPLPTPARSNIIPIMLETQPVLPCCREATNADTTPQRKASARYPRLIEYIGISMGLDNPIRLQVVCTNSRQ